MDELMKQSSAYQTLAAFLRGGRLPHALLIEGGGRQERMQLARTAAMAALCEGEQPPCGNCRHCVKAQKEIHPDILLCAGEGGARSFHIDTVRAIRQQAFVRPNEASGKVFILDQVQEMSAQAQNALLKIAEEPPPGVFFFMTCENKSAMLPTILSRVTVLSLQTRPAGREEGSPEGDAERENACKVLLALGGFREMDALEIMAGYERNRAGLAALLEEMRRLLCALLVSQPAGGQDETGEALRKRLSRLQMVSIVDIIDEMARAAAENGNGLLLTTAFCARVKRALE